MPSVLAHRFQTLKPSACTPLFLAAYEQGAGCCIHTHSQWAVLVTLLVERDLGKEACFEIECIEQIKGVPRGKGKQGNLGYYDRLRIPIIENTAHEEDLKESLEEAIRRYPDTYAILVRRHGIYVWGDNVQKAKTLCESLDYIFQLAVEMRKQQLLWAKPRTTWGKIQVWLENMSTSLPSGYHAQIYP